MIAASEDHADALSVENEVDGAVGISVGGSNRVGSNAAIQGHFERRLGLDVDVVEFCPSPKFQNVLAVGTYTLVEVPYTRIGELHLYQLNRTDTGSLEVAEILSHSTAAIFDLKWAPFLADQAAVLAQAGADGSVQLYNLTRDDNDDAQKLSLHVLDQASCSPGGGLATSVDWSQANVFGANLLATSSSACELAVFDVSPSGLTPLIELADAHELEIWMVSFDRWKKGVLYSGADDCFFKGWDLRTDCTTSALDPLFSNRKTHRAGVCCIVPSSNNESVVATGSYDGFIRLWDTRQLSRPVNAVEAEGAGGVWRLKWHPERRDLLVAACMHGGFCLFQYGQESLQILDTYAGPHESLAYGVDWCHDPTLQNLCETDQEEHNMPTRKSSLLASCSFYDRRLHLWSTTAGHTTLSA